MGPMGWEGFEPPFPGYTPGIGLVAKLSIPALDGMIVADKSLIGLADFFYHPDAPRGI